MTLVLLTAVFPASAQNGASFLNADTAAVPYMATPFAPALPCASLLSRTGHDYSIVSAAGIEGSAETPAHCEIDGVIPGEIRFRITLPSRWNGRFYMHGNGGYAGTPPDDPNRLGLRNLALRHGFATAFTDTGHDKRQQPLGTFGHRNLARVIDYGYRAVHLTVVTAKELIGRYYGRSPTYSYWDGCSTGGRQGLMSAQRFPEDFDGIVAGAPVLDFSGTMVSYLWNLHALAQAKLGFDKLEQVGRVVYQRCDSMDGLADGLIVDPRRCDFDPERHLQRCSDGGESDCFTAADITALKTIFGGVVSQGVGLYPGQPLGAEIDRGWGAWILSEGRPSISEQFGTTFFRYLAYPEDDPEFDWRSFDFDRDPGRIGMIKEILDATDPDLSAFRDRGGRLLMHFGWSDTALNPVRAIQYYETVMETMGDATRDFFRLFMVPGMKHCRGGRGTDRFDAMTPLIEWVERGRAPESLIASHGGRGVKRSRPLCPHPQVARYRGTGPTEEAGSFACVEPESRQGQP